jgi:hypothetical protein
MEQTTMQQKYTSLLNELYRSFHFFNQHYCKGELKEPIITMQGDKRKGSTYGWFGKEFWTEYADNKPVQVNEINLTAEALYRSPNEVLETLIHEMVHLKNSQEGINDCTKTQYHNEAFKKVAESFGLTVERMRGKGWAKTSLGEQAQLAIDLLKPDVSVYNIARTPPEKITPEAKTISINIDLTYQEKLDYLEEAFGKKRAIAEAAIDLLYERQRRIDKADEESETNLEVFNELENAE